MKGTRTIDEETSLVKISLTKCKHSCILYIVLFSIFFTISIVIATYFVYYKYMNHNKEMFLNMIISIKENGSSKTNRY